MAGGGEIRIKLREVLLIVDGGRVSDVSYRYTKLLRRVAMLIEAVDEVCLEVLLERRMYQEFRVCYSSSYTGSAPGGQCYSQTRAEQAIGAVR